MANLSRRFNTFMSLPGVAERRRNAAAASRRAASSSRSDTRRARLVPHSSQPALKALHKRNADRSKSQAETYSNNGLVERINRGNAHPGLVMLARLHQRMSRLRRPTGAAAAAASAAANPGVRRRNAQVEPVEFNPPPAGVRVNTIAELRTVPNSHMVHEEAGLTFAISLETIENGLDNFGARTTSFRLLLLSSLDPSQSGLDLVNGPASLIEVIMDLLDHAVNDSVRVANVAVDVPREIQISLGNVHIIDREVASGIFLDTPENRIALIRSLLDQLLVTTNSSDSHTSFQELVIAITVRFPTLELNDLAGDGHRLEDGSGPYLPFGIRLHKRKAMTKKRPKGQLLYVKSTTQCWCTALFLGITHWMLKRQIRDIEVECSSRLAAMPPVPPTDPILPGAELVPESPPRSRSSSRSSSPFFASSSPTSSPRSSSPILSFPITEDGTGEVSSCPPSQASSVFTPPEDMFPTVDEHVVEYVPAADVRARMARCKVLKLRNQLFGLLDLEGSEQLEAALGFFEGVGINMEDLVAEHETFDMLAKALNFQIVILDEASDYQNVRIFPSRVEPETNAVVYTYDETRETIYLLRIVYPSVEPHGMAKDYYHYHALVSPNALLYSRLKRICLYCRSVFDVRWSGHRCKEQFRTSCNNCVRVQFADHVDPDILGDEHASLYTDLSHLNFCFRLPGDMEKYQCKRCMEECASQTCLDIHRRSKMCKTSSVCTKCGQRFLCLGVLAPKKVDIVDSNGVVTGEEEVRPTEHINCLHCKSGTLIIIY